MKQLQKIIAVLLAVILAVGVFAGCGSESTVATASEPAAQTQGATDAAEATDAPVAEVTGGEVNLSDPDFDFEAEFYYNEYNAESNADTDRQDGIDTFENTDIVFQSIDYEELIYLLEQEGNYLILFGGVWCHNTRAVVSYINDYAHEYGIDTVYNFDFRLDGTTGDTHIRVSNSDSEEKTGGEQFNYLYGELISRYLTNLNDWVEYQVGTESDLTYTNASGEDVTVAKVQVPFLFLYNKDNTVDNSGNGGAEGTYPIVYGFEEMVDRDSQGVYVYEYDEEGNRLTDENENPIRKYITEEYLERLRGIFDYIKDNGLTVGEFTDADYIRLSFNEERFERLEGVEYRAGNPIFAEDDQINLDAITYRELIWLLQQEGDSLIFFGGPWCANTQAAIATVNDYAVANGQTVYWYDPAWDSYYSVDAWDYDQRSDPRYGGAFGSSDAFVPGYVNLVKNYLTNLTVADDFIYTDDSGTEYTISYTFDYTDEEGNTFSVGTFQVPYLLAYNKDAVDSDGFSAPIFAFVEDAVYHLEEGADDYIYNSENYAKYTQEVYDVFAAFAARLGLTASDITKRV